MQSSWTCGEIWKQGDDGENAEVHSEGGHFIDFEKGMLEVRGMKLSIFFLFFANLDSRKMWNVLNNLMGRTVKSTPHFLEANGKYLAKPMDSANYFLTYYFSQKIQDLQGLKRFVFEQ